MANIVKTCVVVGGLCCSIFCDCMSPDRVKSPMNLDVYSYYDPDGTMLEHPLDQASSFCKIALAELAANTQDKKEKIALFDALFAGPTFLILRTAKTFFRRTNRSWI
ncbi:MAG: hypothetical protein LBF54_04305 [Holosporaceae bacterium]|jgi:hypothetical protein|nr:hypothetical protein [Holosporaceae bacterium]